MKKLLVTLAVAITGAVQAFALTPMAIRENARFLTDRMAYELNLTPQQIEDCYEINYDFIASINPIMDEVVYGYPEYIDRYYNYLDYRNDDLRYIMTEAQYLAFMSLDYCMPISVPSIAVAVATTSVLTPHVPVRTQRPVTLLLLQGTREWITGVMTTTVATTMASTIAVEATTTIAAILAAVPTKAAMVAATTTAIAP